MNLNSVTPMFPTTFAAMSAQQNTASTAACTTAKLRRELQQLQAQNPQEFQAMLSQLTGQIPQNASSHSQTAILNWL